MCGALLYKYVSICKVIAIVLQDLNLRNMHLWNIAQEPDEESMFVFASSPERAAIMKCIRAFVSSATIAACRDRALRHGIFLAMKSKELHSSHIPRPTRRATTSHDAPTT
jgi:hypothetical protein